MSELIPGSLYAFSNLARFDKLCAVHRLSIYDTTESINKYMHSRLVHSQKQLRRDVFMTILINVQHEP